MKTKTNTTADIITATYADYDKDVSAVLANLDRTTPTPIIRQLQNMKKPDQVARANPATAEAISEAEEAHADYTESIEALDRITHRITADEAERVSAWQEAESMRAEAEEARNTAHDLHKTIERTLSDRADLLQVCAEADRLWRTNGMSAQTALVFHDGAWKRRHTKSARESAQTIQAIFNALETLKRMRDTKPEPTNRTAWKALDAGRSASAFYEMGYKPIFTWADVDNIARKRYRRNAVSRYIRAQKSGTALDGTHTDKKSASHEEVTAWTMAGKLTGQENRYQTKAGTISLEYREATKSNPSGWYFINRRYTVNRWHSIEALTETGEITGIIRTTNTYAENLEAVERIEHLITAGNPQPRERAFLEAFCSQSAVEASEEARRAYTEAHTTRTDTGHKYNGTAQGRSTAGYEARRAYAYNRIGLFNPNTASQFFRRMCARLEVYKQTSNSNGQTRTPAELAERDRRYWEHMQRSNQGNSAPSTAHRPDLIAWTEQATYPVKVQAVTWQGEGWKQAEPERTAEAYRKAWSNSQIDNSTPEARAEADTNGKRYGLKSIASNPARIHALTAEEVADIWNRYTKHQARATHTAKARAEAKASKARARAERTEVQAVTITAKQWNEWTPGQRLAHVNHVLSIGKRTEFVKA